MIRVGIDARWIFKEISGIGQYTTELVRYLAPHDETNAYVLFFEHEELRDRLWQQANLDQYPNFKACLVPYGVFSIRNQLAFGRVLRQQRLHVFHSPNFMIPLPPFARRRAGQPRALCTIHDLIPLLHPEYTPRALKTRLFPIYRALMRKIAARCALVLTVSEASRADILHFFNLPAQQVRAIPNGVGTGFSRRGGDQDLAPAILFVGRQDPYKNLPLLIEAFARLHLALPEARLVVVGAADPRYPAAAEAARRLGINEFIDWKGYVDARRLAEAYRQASVYVLPSRYEGFGLTVLEAMACGTPVVCSDIPALREVAGEAALFVPPGDADALAAAIRRLLADPETAGRLRSAGVHRALEFSWRRTAAETLKAYEWVAALP